jgi:hypothetical protein
MPAALCHSRIVTTALSQGLGTQNDKSLPTINQKLVTINQKLATINQKLVTINQKLVTSN